MALFDSLFSSDSDVRRATLTTLPQADPDEVEAIFKGLSLNEHEGFRWSDRFRRTWFNRNRRQLRTWLNLVLGYVPTRCKGALASAGRLRTLTMGGQPGSPAPMTEGFDATRFKKARSLRLEFATVDTIEGLTALPELEYLGLSQLVVTADAPVRLGPKVQTLALTEVEGAFVELSGPGLRQLRLDRTAFPLEALHVVEKLTALEVRAHPGLVDFQTLPTLPALVRLGVWACPRLVSFEGLERQPGLDVVMVDEVPELTSLSGLPATLGALHLRGVPKLRSLEGVPAMPEVTSFAVSGATTLTMLEPLVQAAPALERLTLHGIRRKAQLAALAELSSLTVLDLRTSPGISSVEPFLDHPTLRALLLSGTKVQRSAVPPRDRWRCSWAQSPNIDELASRTPPAKETWEALKGPGRTVLAKIRKLVRAQDLDVIEQGLELLAIVDDPHVYDALLEGADYRQVRMSSRLNRRPWRLGSRRFVGPSRAYVLHRLLAEAPAESTFAAALREQIHTLDFVEPHYPAKPHPLDLASLAALPDLRSLAFARFGPLTLADEDEPGTIERLETLEIHHPQGTVPAAWLAAQTHVQTIKLFGEGAGSRDLTFARHLPRLRTLEVSQQTQLDLGQLAGVPALQELSIASCAGLSSLEGLPAGLRVVKVSWCWQLTDLGPLLDMGSLEAVRIYGCAIPEAQIAALEARGITRLT